MLIMRSTLTIVSTLLISACVSLTPMSGGVQRSNGHYMVQESGPVQIEIVRVGVGTQLARVEVILRNMTNLAVKIDYSKTVIITDTGEQIRPLMPEQAASSISVDAFSTAMLGANKAQASASSSGGEVMRNGIGKVIIQPKVFIQGAFFFKPPDQPYNYLTFVFEGIPGSPEVKFSI